MNGFDVNARLSEALSGADESDFPPELLEEWEPIECLARSRLSETFLMRNKRDGSSAVAKLIEAEQPENVLTASLKDMPHPGLPRVFNVWTGGGKTCVLREYIEGTSLADHKGGFSEQDVIRIGIKLSEILEYLHGRTPPVIHRDVKPENIILRDGMPVLIDFGIARLYSASAKADTKVMGTERFAPPEQYGFQQTDARSDIYSLGVTLRWMLAGGTDGEGCAIKNKRLAAVLNRCTAFSPDDRFADAAALRKALRRCEARKGKKLVLAACAVVLVAAVALCLLLTRDRIAFVEPMIEQAARMSLGIPEDEPLTRELLDGVQGLYIFADTVCADQDGYDAAADAFYAAGDMNKRGPVATLKDLRLMPSLKVVMIAAQKIGDISPLKGLSGLEKLDIKHNGVSDVSALEGKNALYSLGLNGNPVVDLSVLTTLPALNNIDLCDADACDPAFLSGLGDLDFLDAGNRTDCWRHLGTLRIRQLKLVGTGLDDLQAIAGVGGVQSLNIKCTRIASLRGIEAFEDLVELNIVECKVEDLTPVLKLPKLEKLVVSRHMEPLTAALGDVTFKIEYE